MTELAIRDQSTPAIRPELPVPAANDLDSWTKIVGQVIKLANEIYDTPFVPDGLRGSSPAVAAAILSGREMGLGPMTSLANIDVIRGKPTQKPLLMRAMILSRGHKWEDVENSDFRAVVRGCRKGESQWTTVTFTAAQAKTAGLDMGKYPADKLYARATSRLAKHKFADVIMGMAYSSDEVEDGIEGEIAVTSEGETAPPAIEAAKPAQRTARRRQAATKDPSPAPATAPPAESPSAPPAERAGEALPPLPGEEEDPTTSGASSSAGAPVSGSRPRTGAPSPSSPSGSASTPDDTDYDTPGTVTGPQLTRIWATLTSDLGVAESEKDQAREICAQIVRHDLTSSNDLSRNEAKAVIDTLSQVSSREDLMALLVAMDKERGQQ